MLSLFIILGALGAPGDDAPKDEAGPGGTRVKVLKVWASDDAGKDGGEKDTEKGGKYGAKDELKEYRKLLEAQSGKRHFEIAGKEIRDAVPGKTLVFPLFEDLRLTILPIQKGKAKGAGKDEEGKLVLQIKLLQIGRASCR